MKIAYVIAPYRAKTLYQLHKNIQRAEECAAQLWRFGFAVICPHKNSAYFDGIMPDETFINGDLEILRRCDFVVCADDSVISDGMGKELDFAYQHNIQVYRSLQDALESEVTD